MVDIIKSFNFKSRADLLPGELISGMIDGEKSLGIVIPPTQAGMDAIVIGRNRYGRSLYLGAVEYFGLDKFISHSDRWSIKINDNFVAINNGARGEEAPGDLVFTPQTTLIGISSGGEGNDQFLINLDGFAILHDIPQRGQYAISRRWSIWLHRDLADPNGKPFYSFPSAVGE